MFLKLTGYQVVVSPFYGSFLQMRRRWPLREMKQCLYVPQMSLFEVTEGFLSSIEPSVVCIPLNFREVLLKSTANKK